MLEARAGYVMLAHHRVLFRARRGKNGQARDRPRAARQRFQQLAALGRDAWLRRRRGLYRRAEARVQAGHRICSAGCPPTRRGPNGTCRSQIQMSSAAAPSSMASKTAEHWREALLPVLGSSPGFAEQFFARLRAAKLTFGDRVHCPFLRPFFVSPEDEQRVRIVAETVAALGERVASAALADRGLFAQLRLRPEEERLARLHAGYGLPSTASRLDAFLLPDSLKCAEYNGESPAGAGYSETLSEIFRELPVMTAFCKQYEVHSYPLSAKLLDALMLSYVDWGGTSKRPQIAIVDWREVPTWSEFEILQGRFEKLDVPTLIADPRDLVFDGKTLAAHGTKIDLLYRRVLINDIVGRAKECEALVKAYSASAVCVANTFRCKIPHVKAFFAVLTDERNGALFSHQARGLIHRHIPRPRVVQHAATAHYAQHTTLLPLLPATPQ